MASNGYEVIIAPDVLDKIEQIENYIAENFSIELAKKRTVDIFDSLGGLELFPELGFDFDSKIGRCVDNRVKTRGIILKQQYIALYYVEVQKKRVTVTHLFSTKEDYLKLFR